MATVAERNRAEAGSIGKCFIADVRFDDASKTSELCDLAETGDVTALFAVEALSHVDASSVEVLAARLKGPPRMRKAVLAGLASIFESSAPNVKDAVITALRERLDHFDADVGAWPGGGAGVALAIGDALRSADPESGVRQAMEILSAGFIPLGTAIGDGRGPEILEQMYHRSTLMGNEHIPSQHGRAEFELIARSTVPRSSTSQPNGWPMS